MKPKTKGLHIIVLGVVMLLMTAAPRSIQAQEFLQRVEIPSSPNPVGSGARAIGMGGAFIAVADDATAASWNPAGLVQLELPETSLVVNALHRIEDNDFTVHPEASGEQTVTTAAINYISAAYPFTFRGYNIAASLNYQALYDFNRKWDFPIHAAGLYQDFDYKQEGKLSAVGLALSAQITPDVSFGLTVNIWSSRINNRWEHSLIQRGFGYDQGQPVEFQSQTLDRFEFSGVNATVGVLWNINKKLTVGAVLKTPFDADIRRDHSFITEVHYPNLPRYDYRNSTRSTENATLAMPLSFGVGTAYKISDVVTISADIYRTEWDDFIYKDAAGNETSFITGKDPSRIRPSFQVRIGSEYIIIKPKYVTSVCAGVFYDPAPSEGNPDDSYGVSIGTGFGIAKLNFNIAYQCRFGNHIGDSILKNFGFSQDSEEHSVYTSVIVHF